MAGPVLATKLYAPRLPPGSVSRPRLRERLGRAAAARLTLVSAPAGFGKTTLLAEWLHEPPGDDGPGRAVAWLSLDAADGEPASFWTGVVTALRTALPGVGAGALALIGSPSPSLAPAGPVLTTLLNELAAVPGEAWLVLDDYHLVDGREVGAGMAFFLEHLPPRLHVVLSTRADPDLPLSRWRVRGELTEVRAADLRFTADEAAGYLNGAAGLDLAPADVAALEARTEGWIAALQLAVLSIRGREDASAFIARFAGDDRYVVDYLVDEVLRHQPGPVRDFLLRSAVLDRLTGPLCDAVTGDGEDAEGEGAGGGGAGGGDMLVALERANLFIVPLDDRRQWYRYHQLFADVLRARLLAERPGLVPLLHRRASRWFEGQDLLDEAVRHALAGRDFDRAAHLVELAVPAIRRERREATLIGWLKDLPDDVVGRRPVLGVFRAYHLTLSGDLAGAEARLDDAERALAAGPDGAGLPWAETDDLRTLPATIAVHRASLAQARGDVAATARHARTALDLAGPTDHLARGGAAGFLGLAAWARGDVSTALETFTQAVASLHAAGNLVDELSGTVLLADMWLAAGRPGNAVRLYREALAVAAPHGDAVARATAELHVGMSELDLEALDVDGARRHLERAAALRERAAVVESTYRWYVAMSRVAVAEGDPQRAVDLLGTAERLYRPGFYPDVRPVAAMRARVWIAQGELGQAGDWARQRGVSVTEDAGYLGEYDQLTLVRLIVARYRARPVPGGLDQALELLARLEGAARASGRGGSLLEIGILQALVLDAQGRRPLAVQALHRARSEAPEPGGHARLLLDEGPPMAALLRAAGPASGPAAGGPAAGGPAGGLLSERELQVLRLLDTELSGPEIARQLFVSQNTLRTHTKHIFTKLDVTSRRAAVRRARERGLL